MSKSVIRNKNVSSSEATPLDKARDKLRRELQIEEVHLMPSSSRLSLELTQRLMPSSFLLTYGKAVLLELMFILIAVLNLFCDSAPIHSGEDSVDRKLIYYNASVTTTTATITWMCNVKSVGYLIYGLKNPDTFLSYGNKAKFHTVTLSNLPQTTTYKYYVSCGEFGSLKGTSLPQTFTTLTSINDVLIKQSIWLLGGTANGNAVAQVDVYDTVNNAWYANYTSIPTPRIYAGIVSNNGKIYVMGGMTKNSNGTYSVTNIVEEYTPTTNSWVTMTVMPSNLQGFVAASVGQDIYLVGLLQRI